MDRPLEKRELDDPLNEERAQNTVARILARRGIALESAGGQDHSWDAGVLERGAKAGTQRVQSRRNDREDISEVKYRQIRLEYVVLMGLRTTQGEKEINTSLRELAALAETTGSQVLDAVV